MWIAITQRNDLNKHGEYVDSLESGYIKYFEEHGVNLVLIPNSSKKIEECFEKMSFSGIILSGGNSINPKLYGVNETADGVSDERDNTEKLLLDLAVKKRIPVLGICRGMQFINVYFGGKLIKVNNHVISSHGVLIKHEEINKGTLVNSYHNFGVSNEVLAKELKPFATNDSVIEGLYHPNYPIAGIQWHPERESIDKDINDKIINAFLKGELFWKK